MISVVLRIFLIDNTTDVNLKIQKISNLMEYVCLAFSSYIPNHSNNNEKKK